MKKRPKGFVKEIVLLIVVAVLITGLTGWHIRKEKDADKVPEITGRVIENIKTNPEDVELLKDLAREGNPFVYEPVTYERTQRSIDLKLQPTNTFKISGITFKYAPILTVEKTSTTSLRIFHKVDSPEHADFCDLSGKNKELNSEIEDFSARLRVQELSVTDTLKQDIFKGQSQEFFEALFDQYGRVILQDGFISEFKTSIGKGYIIQLSVEGCGNTTYVLPVAKDRTVVVERDIIPYLNPLFSEYEEYLAITGVIDPPKEEYLFSLIFQSINYHE